jgi:hypothetical protein
MKAMSIRPSVFAAAAVLLSSTVSSSDYPILDGVAQKVIQKYQSSTCEQLWAARGQPKSAEEQKIVQLLQGDPQMRTIFINEIAAPVANKMFECAMIP